jgi:putative component of membrane protein insertase Oxa1/YidC/SpoIIIJ protein YidD
MRVVAAVALVAAAATAACTRPAVRVGSPCTAPRAFAPFDDRPAAETAPPDAAATDGLVDAIIAWYQADGRAPSLPGVGCPFAPTCSVYARTALRRYGPLAVILIVDRLIVREHPIAGAYYPAICVAHTTRLVDDVP